jgi:NAD(P)-dependent dehydrogenase (short-subunit alcohol dehydrogenase family)
VSGRVAGKIALVTGAAQGIGAAIAWALAREGAKALVTDINAEGVAAVANAIDAELGPGVAYAMRRDVTSEADWIAVIAQAQDVLGGLSVLVNNAGIAQVGSVEDLSFAEWRRGTSVNADSVFLGCKYALPLMR